MRKLTGFRWSKPVKGRQLLQQHPEFEAAARAADAKREAEMEAAEIALAARVEAVEIASAPATAEPSGDATAPT